MILTIIESTQQVYFHVLASFLSLGAKIVNIIETCNDRVRWVEHSKKKKRYILMIGYTTSFARIQY
jgi:hypothetical protein